MAQPLNSQRLIASRYNISSVQGSLDLQQTFRDFWAKYKDTNSTGAKAFVDLIMHNLEYFRIAAMEIDALRDNAPAYTKDDNGPMIYLYSRTKLYRPLPPAVVNKHEEHDLLKSAYAHRLLGILYPFQADAQVDTNTRAIANLTGTLINELFGDKSRLVNDAQFMSFVNRYAGTPFTSNQGRNVAGSSSQPGSRSGSGAATPLSGGQSLIVGRARPGSQNLNQDDLLFTSTGFEAPSNPANMPRAQSGYPPPNQQGGSSRQASGGNADPRGGNRQGSGNR